MAGTVRQDKVQVLVEINGTAAGQTLKDLNGLERDLVRTLRNDLIPGTKEWIEAASKLRDVKTQIKDLNEQFKPLEISQQKQITAFAKIGQGIAAAFAISKILPFGKSQQDVAKATEQAQKAIAIVMSARAIAEALVESRVAARIVLEKAASVQTAVLSAVTGAYATVVGVLTGAIPLATAAQLAWNAAVNLFPGAAIVTAIGLAVTAFIQWTRATSDQTSALKLLNDELDHSIKLVDDSIDSINRTSAKRLEDLKLQLDLAEAQKKSAVEIGEIKRQIFNEEQTQNEELITQAQQKVQLTQQNLNAVNDELDEQKRKNKDDISEEVLANKKKYEEQLVDATAFLDKLQTEQKQSGTKRVLLETLINADINKAHNDLLAKEEAADKKLAEDRLAREQKLEAAVRKLREDRLTEERRIRQLEIDLMDEGSEKEIAKLKNQAQLQIDALLGDPKAIIERGDLITQEIILINQNLQKDLDKMGADNFTKRIEDEQKLADAKVALEKEAQRQIFAGEIQLAIESVALINQIIQNSFQKRVSESEAAKLKEEQDLDSMLNRELISQDEYNKKKAAIDKKFDEQAKSIKRKAAHAQKEADIIQATINTALAVTNAFATAPTTLAGPILAAIAGAAGALQIALILAQPDPQFRVGGYTGGKNKGRPAGIVHEDEWVANSEMVNHPVYGNIIQYLESARTRGFAAGGFTSTPSTTITNNVNNLSSSANSSNDLIVQLRNIENAINNQQKLIRAFIPYNDLKTALDIGDELTNKSQLS